MRISSIQIYSQSVNEMLDKQSDVSKLQVHIASGKKIFTPSDDPVGASKAMLLKQELNVSNLYQKNCLNAKNMLEHQEIILRSSVNIVQRISELAVQAASGALSDTDRYAIVQEIDARKNELFSLSNAKDSNGDYAFSGFKGNLPALKISNNGSILYQGDDGQRQLKLGASAEIQSNITGKSLFFNIDNENVLPVIKEGVAVATSLHSGLINSSDLPTLSNIDLVINGVNIPNSVSDNLSTTDSSGSAIAFAQAINAVKSDHHVWASALPNQLNLGVFTSGAISSNQFSINQIPIVDPVGSETSLINAINLNAALTGVIATQPGGIGTAIWLNAADGRNIQVKTNGSSTAGFANFNLSGGLDLDQVQRAGISLRSGDSIQIGGANPSHVGIVAGTFSASINTGTGVIQSEVISSIADLNQNYSVVFGAGGTTFSIIDDAYPFDVIEGYENLTYSVGETINFKEFKLTLNGMPQSGDVFNLGSEKPVYQDIFKTINKLMHSIKSYGKDQERLNYEIGLGLSNLAHAQNNFSQIQSIVGSNLNVAESQQELQSEFELMTREVLSQVEDLDYAETISALTQATFVLEAAQKSFVHIQSLSIFNYLR